MLFGSACTGLPVVTVIPVVRSIWNPFCADGYSGSLSTSICGSAATAVTTMLPVAVHPITAVSFAASSWTVLCTAFNQPRMTAGLAPAPSMLASTPSAPRSTSRTVQPPRSSMRPAVDPLSKSSEKYGLLGTLPARSIASGMPSLSTRTCAVDVLNARSRAEAVICNVWPAADGRFIATSTSQYPDCARNAGNPFTVTLPTPTASVASTTTRNGDDGMTSSTVGRMIRTNGGVVSRTVTVNEPWLLLPCASVAVQLTVVVPIGNGKADAGWQST